MGIVIAVSPMFCFRTSHRGNWLATVKTWCSSRCRIFPPMGCIQLSPTENNPTEISGHKLVVPINSSGCTLRRTRTAYNTFGRIPLSFSLCKRRAASETKLSNPPLFLHPSKSAVECWSKIQNSLRRLWRGRRVGVSPIAQVVLSSLHSYPLSAMLNSALCP